MIFLCFLVFLRGLCAFAEDADTNLYPSLFFTDEEIARGHEKNQKTWGTPSLSAILYHDEDHWAVWINDKIIRPDNVQEVEEFHIENVSLQDVIVSRPSPEGEGVETLTLRPY